MLKYNKKTMRRELNLAKVDPCDVIIVEGHLIFAEKTLLDMFDLKIYVVADIDIRWLRVILREMNEVVYGNIDISN